MKYLNHLIVECTKCKEHFYFYDFNNRIDLCNEECNCGGTFIDILPKQVTIEDFAIICGNNLENNNFHSIAELPEKIGDILKNNKTKALKIFSLFNNISN